MTRTVSAVAGSPTSRVRTTFHAVLSMFLMALVMASVSEAATTAAPSDEAVISLVKRTNKDCSVDRYRTIFRGVFPGADMPVTIATFAVEGCGGGSNGGGSFGVFSGEGGTVVEWPQSPIPAGRVDGIELAGGKLLVQWMAFKPTDPMCCPSAAHRTSYRLNARKVVLDH